MVHKRSGEYIEEAGDTLYELPLSVVKIKLAHESTIKDFEDSNVSLKEYLNQFYKNYNEVCKLLKKIL